MWVFRNIMYSQKGQSLTELGLILPLLLILGLGAIEFSNMAYTYFVLSHLTREGANMTSRQTPPNTALDAIIDAACPVISNGPPPPTCPPDNSSEWTIIYSEIGPNPGNPNQYVVLEQIVRGALGVDSRRICPSCSTGNFTCTTGCQTPTNVPDLASIGVGQNLYAIEVFYQYQTITPLGNFLGYSVGGPSVYERAIF